MADASRKDPWFVSAAVWFYDAWNFAQFLSGLTFGAWASQLSGIEWSTPVGPWLLVAAAIMWGFAVVWIVRRVVAVIRTVIDKPHPQIEVLSSGTAKAVLEIAHFGAPVTYRAEGRIARVLSPTDMPRPPEQRFTCELHPEEGRVGGTRLRLRDGEWAHIIIGESSRASIHDDGHVLWIRRGSYGRQARAPDSGVEVEYSIQMQSPFLKPITRRIRVTRDNASRTVAAVVVDD